MFNLKKAFVAILALGGSAFALTELNDATFDKVVPNDNNSLVLFHAPWCGHCKRFKPVFTEACQTIEKTTNVKCHVVDVTDARGLSARYEIRGIPTLKQFAKGQFVKDYRGERTVEAVINYAKTM